MPLVQDSSREIDAQTTSPVWAEGVCGKLAHPKQRNMPSAQNDIVLECAITSKRQYLTSGALVLDGETTEMAVVIEYCAPSRPEDKTSAMRSTECFSKMVFYLYMT